MTREPTLVPSRIVYAKLSRDGRWAYLRFADKAWQRWCLLEPYDWEQAKVVDSGGPGSIHDDSFEDMEKRFG